MILQMIEFAKNDFASSSKTSESFRPGPFQLRLHRLQSASA